jgi:hypothetical protein
MAQYAIHLTNGDNLSEWHSRPDWDQGGQLCMKRCIS